VIRWIPGVFKFRDTLYAHLSLKALAAYTDSNLDLFVDEVGVDRLQIGNFQIPTDELGRIMINYRGGTKRFPHISATDILNDRVDPRQLKDKLVIVGVTAIGVYDLRVTPFDTDFPGVEINANLIDSILSRDFLYQPAQAQIYNILAMPLLGGFLGWLLPRISVIPRSHQCTWNPFWICTFIVIFVFHKRRCAKFCLSGYHNPFYIYQHFCLPVFC